ncbi:5-methyltetrahydropteroyltriglutamate--homocysteine S-methyltransferase, partial [Vibrio sp. 10N.222.49.C9]
QKVAEVNWLAKALEGDKQAIEYCEQYSQPIIKRQQSTLVNKASVQTRLANLTPADAERSAKYAERSHHQKEVIKLPLLPTTTIGSFPQTSEVRKTRAAFKRGELTQGQY